jgi:hypothetical protein
MRRLRAGWVLGLGLLVSGAAVGCGNGDSAGLFTTSTVGAGASGASNQAGAHNDTAGDDAGGASNQSGGAGSDQTSGAPGAGMTSTDGGSSGATSGGSAGRAGATGKAGSGGMSGDAGGGASGSAGAAGSSGNAGAGGAAAGAGGSGGTAGGAGSGGASGGGGTGPVSCSDNAGCTPSQYCAKDCSLGATGTCTARPTDCSGTAETALCGCDGFTYHDACLMHLNGQNSLATGACNKAALGTATCSAANDTACTVKGGVCGFRADTACPSTLPLKGICWVIPATCPPSAESPKGAEVCNPSQQGPNSLCATECMALKNQVRYAVTVMCN